MDLRKKIGIEYGDITPNISEEDNIKFINLKLSSLGLPIYKTGKSYKESSQYIIDLFEEIIDDYKEKMRLRDSRKIPINKRVYDFLNEYFKDSGEEVDIVEDSFILDRYGLARALSLPPNGDEFISEYSKSYKIKQGILNNPKNDRRTTKGSFHIVEGGLKIPFDKKVVPKITFLKLYNAAINPPEELKILPFTSNQENKAKTFVSLLVKPAISPEVPGVVKEKNMEILFITPGSLVSNLDFVESVFGNSGDFGMHTKDSSLDVENWAGHTGYIILAPHLTTLKKKDLGLPHFDDANERQRNEGMCYKDDNELYNDGSPFKITCRDNKGVIITLIADNYFGYSKKEIKTQMSYASNLYGMSEEEHSGGTIAFRRTSVGENFDALKEIGGEEYSFEYIKKNYSSLMDLKKENYGIDKVYKNIFYVPENIEIDLHKTEIKWIYNDKYESIKLLPTYYYILPSGDKFHMEKHPITPAWKLIRTASEGTNCHKPCTVSGGGKSEISKSLDNSIIYGTYYSHNLIKDLDRVEEIMKYDYKHRWNINPNRKRESRPILSAKRSLGSVIKLLMSSKAYTDEFNNYLAEIPNYIKALVFMVKRFYLIEWGDDWRSHFTVDEINGRPGNSVKYNGRKIRPSYLRVGFNRDGSWRIFKLRMDFLSAEKIQTEDDISVSVVLPRKDLNYIDEQYKNPSFKFAMNCEYRLFQRPDEAINIGYDKKAEYDLSQDNIFVTNYEPLDKKDVQKIKDDVMNFVSYTAPVTEHIEKFLKGSDKYCIVSSEPRILDDKSKSKNIRYLENRGDFLEPIKNYISDVGSRFARKIPVNQEVLLPINAILTGRKNNPPGKENGKKIQPLSVYNPLHYQELPELFMDFMASLSGKSPSTTGAGSEGALTKGPFNMLLPTYDLNNALLSYILTNYVGFSTPSGYIGPYGRVDHDISMLIPEMWCKLSESEKKPKSLIEEGALKKIDDFEHNGEKILASRLGYRITRKFAYLYMGKIFDEPQTVFDNYLLEPETQDLEAFVDGVKNIVNGHEKIAKSYISDGTADDAIPPLKALIYIMANGEYKDMKVNDEKFRDLFKYEYVINSDWYKERLINKQKIEIRLMKRKIDNLQKFIKNPINESILTEFGYKEKLVLAKEKLEFYKSDKYLKSLEGTIGADNVSLR
jgi:hypothetical protein